MANLIPPALIFFPQSEELLSLIRIWVFIDYHGTSWNTTIVLEQTLLQYSQSKAAVELHIKLYQLILSFLWKAHGMFYMDRITFKMQDTEFRPST